MVGEDNVTIKSIGPPVAADVRAGPTPVVSAEVFVVPLATDDPGRYLVYAPLRRAAFVGNAAVVNLMADLREGKFDLASDPDGSLVEFLRRLEILDAGPEEKPITTFDGDPTPTSVTLFLTTACNLRCTYCYASAGDTPARSMPLVVAKRGIDFVLGNALRKGLPSIEVAYHGGGEPTVNWHTLTSSLEYAREQTRQRGLHVSASCATNGILNDKQIAWIVANLSGVSLSLDGLPAVHDSHRPLVSGKGSSERVIHTLRRFDECEFPYGLRVTVTADQIETLPDSIDYICANFAAQRIQVEPSYQMGRWRDAPSAETVEFIRGYREAQVRARHYGREIFYSAARVGQLTNHFCGITQDSFALSPDGNVSACYEVFSEQNTWAKVFFYGYPNTEKGGYAFDLAKLNHLRRQAVQHRDYCRGCFAKWNCAGDCYHKALTVGGGTEFRGSDRCHVTREIIKDQILTKIAVSGGLFWHEPHFVQAHSAGGKKVLL